MKLKLLESMRMAALFFTPLLLVIGIVGLIVMSVLSSTSPKIDATILSYESYINEEGDELFNPIYLYKVKGKPYTDTSTISSSKKPFKIGEKTKVFLINNNPENAVLYGFKYNLSPFFICIALSLFTFLEYKLINKYLSKTNTPNK